MGDVDMDIPMTLSIHSQFSILYFSSPSIIIPSRLLLTLIDPFFFEVRAGSASHSFSPAFFVPVSFFFDVLVLYTYTHYQYSNYYQRRSLRFCPFDILSIILFSIVKAVRHFDKWKSRDRLIVKSTGSNGSRNFINEACQPLCYRKRPFH